MSNERWTFLTNHGHALLCLAREPSLRTRDVAERLGITERAVQKIVADLVEAGYIEKERLGRRNQYRIVTGQPMRHPNEQHCTVDHLIANLLEPPLPDEPS